MELTDRKIASIKATDRRAEYKDGRWPLVLVVQPSGTKSFQWRGRVAGRDRRKTLGRYRDGIGGVSLREAREMSLRAEADAEAATHEASAPAKSRTVSDLFQIYMSREGEDRANAGEKWRMWESDIRPAIGAMAVSSVTRADVAKIVSAKFDSLKAGGFKGVGANRLHSHLSRFFNWCLVEGWDEAQLEHSPMARVKRPAKERPLDTVLSEQELKWFFAGLQQMKSDKVNDQSAEYARGFEIILRTLTRRSEVFGMQWGWIDGDRLLIPKTKNGDAHLLWLHPSVQRLIGCKPFGATPHDRVFSVHPQSMTKPMRRLRSAMSRIAKAHGQTIPAWSLRDLRRTATTTMGGFLDDDYRQLVPRHIRDRLLNHRERGVIRHYDYHDYFAEKRAALERWNKHLDEIAF